ncbi:MAG: small subunit ribosomal protein, partial [Methanolobus sp.]|nr:small subunit ribosomal protein [Methanolobus sp.]
EEVEEESCAEEAAESDDSIPVEDLGDEQRRLVDGVWQHKHEGYDYWHPVARVHKEG